jgi:hypothetical protein
VNGLLIYVSREDVEESTYVTVRNNAGVVVERISLNYLHQLSDFYGGGGNTDVATDIGFTYIDLGLLHLPQGDELVVTLDCDDTPGATAYIGVAAVIDDLPSHDELAYSYQLHTDSSFSVDAACGLYTFLANSNSEAGLISCKLGNIVRATTVRACNWFANLMGKIESSNTSLGVVFETPYGQPITVNHATSSLVCVVKRVMQPGDQRRRVVTREINQLAADKVRTVDVTSKRAAASA